MDRPDPERYEYPATEPDRIDPPGGYAQMPPSAPDPVEGSTAPMSGDVPPMRTPSTARRFDPWGEQVSGTAELVGMRVEAMDGRIGKVDGVSTTIEDEYLVVDTGPWIFGKKVILPAATIERVDPDSETVFVDRSKDEIKNAPPFDESTQPGELYRTELGDYYGSRRRMGPGQI
jgi:hypothetical protein